MPGSLKVLSEFRASQEGIPEVPNGYEGWHLFGSSPDFHLGRTAPIHRFTLTAEKFHQLSCGWNGRC